MSTTSAPPAAASAGASTKSPARERIGQILSGTGGPLIGLLLLGLALFIATPYFLTANNLLNVLDQVTILGILALGMTFVIWRASPDRADSSAPARSRTSPPRPARS